MIYKKNQQTGEIYEFIDINALSIENSQWPDAIQEEIDAYLLSKIKTLKEEEIRQLYTKCKKSINLTMQIGKNKYLPPVQYTIDDLITLTESKISLINNLEQNNIPLNSIEFTEDNKFIFRINGHKLECSKTILIKLHFKMNEIRSGLYNQQYGFLLNVKKLNTIEELNSFVFEYIKQEEYDLTELFN